MTSSRTQYGHFKFTIMPFRLTNAPTVFMDLMNQVCKPYLDKFVIVLNDIILIYSKSKEGHEVHRMLVLELLKKEKLFAKFSKCEFWLQELHFLWHVVNSIGTHVDPSKIEAIKNWKVPKTPSEIRSLMGLASYYRRFIMNFSKIAKPLTSFIQKNQNDYDCEIRYHPRKANAVADVLSRKDKVKPRRDVRKVIRDEAHMTRYSIHPRVDKMYHELRDMNLWLEDIGNTAKHEYGLSSSNGWTKRYMKGSVGYLLSAEIRGSRLIGPELVQETINKVVLIKEKLKAARERQKSYVDNRRKPLEFEVCDQELFKVLPWKGVEHFGKGMLVPR
nr:putative reverse transcriptase domain-containing protein [Tanacetum cinerariifolium]